jgi:hypothetical protein
MAKLPDDPDELEKLFYIATGKIIREWAELEILLGSYLIQLLQTDSFRARVLWGNMPNLRSRVLLLKKLATNFVDDSVLPQVENLFERIEILGGKRNILAHCLGGVDLKTKRVTFVRDEHDDDLGIDFSGEKIFDLSDIVNWPDDVIRLRSDMVQALNLVRAATHTSPIMHRVSRSGQSASSAQPSDSQQQSQAPSGGPQAPPESSQK